MNLSESTPRPVRVLDEPVARKIAAGEVIDRPHAAVRELLDNAVDAGARNITLSLTGGGIDEIRVTDDGTGMTREDLEVCWLPHATSKIETVDDLEKVRTLGFRGEALSSMAACSRLEIVSVRAGEARRLSVHGGKKVELTPYRGAPGTTVSVRDLFFNMPARRRFLKSARAEATMCRRIFMEKAAAHPELNFRMFSDGVMKMFLPAGSPADRIAAAWPRLSPPTGWLETGAAGDGFTVTAVHARPEISRKDRQYIQIYANRRRIDEFALMQAVEHAYDPWMPGGAFPAAFIFVEIDPVLVDFNIHPAKKEARFRDLPAVRHRIIEAIRDRLTSESYRERAAVTEAVQGTLMSDESSVGPKVSGTPPSPRITGREAPAERRPPVSRYEVPSGYGESAAGERRLYRQKPDAGEREAFAEAAARLRDEDTPPKRLDRHSPVRLEKGAGFRYLGQVMGVFLVAESSGSLFIVDQHAAHERILFERYRNSDPQPERLLIPRPLDLDRQALMKVELRRDRLAGLGVEIEKDGDGAWHLTALPRTAAGMEADVAGFLEEGAGDADALEKDLWADLACKAAVKDNSVLDDDAARRLLEQAFALETPRCPHGRPIWFEVSRKELFELVGRTV